MSTPDIEHFVRGTLGCVCPDEVFRSVSIRRVPPSGGQSAHTEVLVGSRLLIRVAAAQLNPGAGEWLERLVADGRSVRDRHGYNRFRLVIVASAATGAGSERSDLNARFARAAMGDERAHLHVLRAAQLPASLLVSAGGSGPETAAPLPGSVTLAK